MLATGKCESRAKKYIYTKKYSPSRLCLFNIITYDSLDASDGIKQGITQDYNVYVENV